MMAHVLSCFQCNCPLYQAKWRGFRSSGSPGPATPKRRRKAFRTKLLASSTLQAPSSYLGAVFCWVSCCCWWSTSTTALAASAWWRSTAAAAVLSVSYVISKHCFICLCLFVSVFQIVLLSDSLHVVFCVCVGERERLLAIHPSFICKLISYIEVIKILWWMQSQDQGWKLLISLSQPQSVGKSLAQGHTEEARARRKRCQDRLCDTQIWRLRHELDLASLKIESLQNQIK